MDSQGGFSRDILKGDSPGGFSRGILKNPSFGDQQVMSLGIPKRRGTQLRAGWSDSQPVSSVLRSIYATSVDLQNDPFWLHAMSRACRSRVFHLSVVTFNQARPVDSSEIAIMVLR